MRRRSTGARRPHPSSQSPAAMRWRRTTQRAPSTTFTQRKPAHADMICRQVDRRMQRVTRGPAHVQRSGRLQPAPRSSGGGLAVSHSTSSLRLPGAAQHAQRSAPMLSHSSSVSGVIVTKLLPSTMSRFIISPLCSVDGRQPPVGNKLAARRRQARSDRPATLQQARPSLPLALAAATAAPACTPAHPLRDKGGWDGGVWVARVFGHQYQRLVHVVTHNGRHCARRLGVRHLRAAGCGRRGCRHEAGRVLGESPARPARTCPCP